MKNQKMVVLQCLSVYIIKTHDPSTGVMTAKYLRTNKIPIVINGIKNLLDSKPGIVIVLLVTNKLVKVRVVLIPANITETNK